MIGQYKPPQTLSQYQKNELEDVCKSKHAKAFLTPKWLSLFVITLLFNKNGNKSSLESCD
jgi:hypothetical protein